MFNRFLARAITKQSNVLPASMINFQARFIEIDPKLCFVSPNEVQDRLFGLLERFQAVDQEKLKGASTTAQFSDLGLDSLDTVEFLLTVEDEFKVEISDDEAEKIKTLDDAIKFVATNSSAQ